MSIFGLIFFFSLFVLLVGLSLLGSIFRFLFGLGRKTNAGPRHKEEAYGWTGKEARQTTSSSKPVTRKKIFGEDEGEYVDFEEIKDEQ